MAIRIICQRPVNKDEIVTVCGLLALEDHYRVPLAIVFRNHIASDVLYSEPAAIEEECPSMQMKGSRLKSNPGRAHLNCPKNHIVVIEMHPRVAKALYLSSEGRISTDSGIIVHINCRADHEDYLTRLRPEPIGRDRNTQKRKCQRKTSQNGERPFLHFHLADQNVLHRAWRLRRPHLARFQPMLDRGQEARAADRVNGVPPPAPWHSSLKSSVTHNYAFHARAERHGRSPFATAALSTLLVAEDVIQLGASNGACAAWGRK